MRSYTTSDGRAASYEEAAPPCLQHTAVWILRSSIWQIGISPPLGMSELGLASRVTPVQTTMRNCTIDGIAAYCRLENKVSLGFVEGLNNKMRVIQHRASVWATRTTF